MSKGTKTLIAASIILILMLTACSQEDTRGRVFIDKSSQQPLQTFKETAQPLCTQEGKPIIRFFGTSWCPHCKWIKSTYLKVASEYTAQEKIKAYAWELDTNDNLLTLEKDPVPPEELAIFKQFNPKEGVPTFIFGCQYLRIGNGYEQQNDLAAEEAEFIALIDKLIKEANHEQTV